MRPKTSIGPWVSESGGRRFLAPPLGDTTSTHLETVTPHFCFVLFCFVFFPAARLPTHLCPSTATPRCPPPAGCCVLSGAPLAEVWPPRLLRGAEEAGGAVGSLPASSWRYSHRRSPGVLWLLSRGRQAEPVGGTFTPGTVVGQHGLPSLLPRRGRHPGAAYTGSSSACPGPSSLSGSQGAPAARTGSWTVRDRSKSPALRTQTRRTGRGWGRSRCRASTARSATSRPGPGGRALGASSLLCPGEACASGTRGKDPTDDR